MLKLDKAQRLDYLKEMISEAPDEPFGYYALCLENETENQIENSGNWIELLEKFPGYLPSYYMAGEAFLKLGQKEKAILTWRQGLEIAIKQGNHHTSTELKSAIQNALIDDDDEL